MTPLRFRLLRLSDEQGSILIVATIVAAVLILLGTTIIEVGHTMAHRRHLQVQVDAAALAAAQEFPLCTTDAAGTYAAMSAVADKYGGFGGSSSFNQQVGTGSGYAGSVSSAYQSRDYPAGSHPPDPDNIFSDSTPAGLELMTCGDSNDPTSAKFFDVKATETGIHSVFDFLFSPTVNAHARVELKAVNQATGILPLAVPDVRPQFVFAKFIAESGAISCTGQSDPLLDPCEEELVRNPKDTAQWIPKLGQLLHVTVPTGDLGIRMRLVGGANKYATCGTIFVDCYDGNDPTIGVVHVRGWNTAAVAPLVQNASLLNGTCSPDAYFAQADCSAGITADIDLGDSHPVEQSKVWATVDGNGNYPLSTPGTGTGVHTWTLDQGIPVTGAGPHNIQLNWSWLDPTCKSGVAKCTTTGNFFGGQLIQRAYEASPNGSGPLQSVQVYESGGTFGPYSYAGGSAHDLGVTIRTSGVLLLSQPTDPPISLRVFKGGKSASQDQTVDCDAQANLKLWQELQFGCSPWYQTIQPPNPVDCSVYGNDVQQKNWGPQPWHCVPVVTGDRNAQIGKGLNLRIFNDPNPSPNACSAGMVHWIKPANADPNADPPILPGFDQTTYPDDKRVLPLFVTPFGSFGGNGNTNVPIIDFGYFYVTGYSGDPCANGDPNDDTKLLSGGGSNAFVLGHFIKYFPIDAQHHPSDDNCDLTTITPCLGVLTR